MGTELTMSALGGLVWWGQNGPCPPNVVWCDGDRGTGAAMLTCQWSRHTTLVQLCTYSNQCWINTCDWLTVAVSS